MLADVLDKKEGFKRLYKQLFMKNEKKIFPKGLVDHFGQKFDISSTLIFMQKRQRKSIWESST